MDETTDVGRGKTSGGGVLLIGAGPLPSDDTTQLCAYNLHAAKISLELMRAGIELTVVGVDIFNAIADTHEQRDSLTGAYEFISNDAVGRKWLAEHVARKQPRAIVASSYVPASIACELGGNIPLWIDMHGWLPAEAQLKAMFAGDDHFVNQFMKYETQMLQRADHVSVVSNNQLHAVHGELAILGRLSRRNAGFPLASVLPAIAHDWRPELTAAPGGIPEAELRGLPRNAKILLWCGTFNVWTKTSVVFEFIRLLIENEPEWHLVIYGAHIPGHNDENWNRWMDHVQQCSFLDRVHSLSDVSIARGLALHMRADLALCVDIETLERHYGSRTRIADMLAHGLPIAATQGTQIVDELAEQKGILALEGEGPANWAEVVRPYLQSDTLRRNLGERGRQAIMQLYDGKKLCAGLVEWCRNPRRAPDLEFREKLGLGLCDATYGDAYYSGSRMSSVQMAQPLVTWIPQRHVEKMAMQILDPFPPSRRSRLLQAAFQSALSHRWTRPPTLNAWKYASRLMPAHVVGRWQGRIDAWMDQVGDYPDRDQVYQTAARGIYARALKQSASLDVTKAINVLLARHEFDSLEKLECYPQRIEIESTSACNLRCRMCKIPYVTKPALMFKREYFEKVRPFLRYAPTLEIIGEGEPTLNPDLLYFVREGAAQGCYVRMFSNSTRLSPEIIGGLIRAGLGTLVTSIFAGRRETYQSITGSDALDTVIENLCNLRDAKRLMNSPWPRLFINSPLLAESLPTAPELVRIAGHVGAEYISFAASYIHRRDMVSQSILNVDREKLLGIFEECSQIGQQNGVHVVLPALSGDGQMADGSDVRENKFGCLFPWQSLTIRANGDVEICAYNRKITGNVSAQSLDSIWSGEEQRRFRSGETSHNGTDYCQMCYHQCFRAKTQKDACSFPYELCMYGY